MEKGNKVEILRKDIPKDLRDKPKPLLGTVIRTDGEYVYVRPRYQRYEIELYRNEIKTLKYKHGKKDQLRIHRQVGQRVAR